MSTPRPLTGQRKFDPLGPTVHHRLSPGGRRLHYIDDGDRDATVLVFFGGAGTTVRAFGLLEFARTLRLELGIRVISLERNGIGQTEFDPSYAPAQYAADLHWLLDELGVGACSLIAISGGGPYCAAVAAARPDRIRSMHIACAVSTSLPDAPRREWTEQQVRDISTNPVSWWTYGPDSTTHRIPGFADSAYEEAVREFFVRGQMGDPAALEGALNDMRAPFPDLSSVTGPAFLYWGSDDQLVPLPYLEHWASVLPDVRARRVYDGEGHDIQYRHWDQILADVATLDDLVLVSDAQGTRLLTPADAQSALSAGAWLGIAPWRSP